MRRFVLSLMLLFVVLPLVGCDGGNQAVTDPSKVPPLTEDQKKALREADDKVAEEETARRTLPTKKGAK